MENNTVDVFNKVNELDLDTPGAIRYLAKHMPDTEEERVQLLGLLFIKLALQACGEKSSTLKDRCFIQQG